MFNSESIHEASAAIDAAIEAEYPTESDSRKALLSWRQAVGVFAACAPAMTRVKRSERALSLHAGLRCLAGDLRSGMTKQAIAGAARAVWRAVQP